MLTHDPHRSVTVVFSRRRPLAAASRLETRTGGPGHQPRTAGKLPRILLLSALRRRQLQDLQPRDVDHPLFLALARLSAVGTRSVNLNS